MVSPVGALQASLEQTLTGGSQPGSLEALKQMLFTMQNIADEQKPDGYSALEMMASDTVLDITHCSRPQSSCWYIAELLCMDQA